MKLGDISLFFSASLQGVFGRLLPQCSDNQNRAFLPFAGPVRTLPTDSNQVPNQFAAPNEPPNPLAGGGNQASTSDARLHRRNGHK